MGYAIISVRAASQLDACHMEAMLVRRLGYKLYTPAVHLMPIEKESRYSFHLYSISNVLHIMNYHGLFTVTTFKWADNLRKISKLYIQRINKQMEKKINKKNMKKLKADRPHPRNYSTHR